MIRLKLDKNSEMYPQTACIPWFLFFVLANLLHFFIEMSYPPLTVNINVLNLSAEKLFIFKLLLLGKQKIGG